MVYTRVYLRREVCTTVGIPGCTLGRDVHNGGYTRVYLRRKVYNGGYTRVYLRREKPLRIVLSLLLPVSLLVDVAGLVQHDSLWRV